MQALLRGALCQQSAVILICMAVDRYICALHPEKYQQHSSKKVSHQTKPIQISRPNIFHSTFFVVVVVVAIFDIYLIHAGQHSMHNCVINGTMCPVCLGFVFSHKIIAVIGIH